MYIYHNGKLVELSAQEEKALIESKQFKKISKHIKIGLALLAVWKLLEKGVGGNLINFCSRIYTWWVHE